MRKRAWIITLVIFLAGVSLAFGQNKVAPIITMMIDEFQMGAAAAGWMSSIFSVVALITALPASFILQKFGAKRCGIVALTCAIVGSVAGLLCSNAESLMVTRIIEGVGVGIMSVIAPALINMWFPIEKRGGAMGVWSAWMTVSQSLTFAVAAGLTNAFGWKGMWYFGLILLVVSLVLFATVVRRPHADEPNYADVEDTSYSFKQGLKSRSAWFVGISTMCFTFACFGFANWAAPYWSETFGWDIDVSNGYISLIYFIEIFLIIIEGFWLNHVKNRKRIAELAHLWYAVSLFICFNLPSPSLILPFCVFYAIGEGLIPVAFWAVIGQTSKNPAETGVAIGILGLCQNVGILLGPPVVGWFIETVGWRLGSIPMVVGACLGLVFFIFAKIYPVEELSQSSETTLTDSQSE